MENQSLIRIETTQRLSTFAIPNNTHFIRHFLNNKSKKSIHTAKAYETDIKQFFNVHNIEEISLNDIKAVTIFDVEDYVVGLIERGLASTTIHRKITSLSTLYKWLLRYQDNTKDITLIKYNPFGSVKDIKPTLTCEEAEFLTRDEAATMIKKLGTENLIDLRDKTIIGLAIITGLRKSEIINIKLKDITSILDYDVIKVVRKRNKKGVVKINSHVKSLIMEYIKRTSRDINTDKEDYLFKGHSLNKHQCKEKLNSATLNKILRKQCVKFNINKKLRVHSLRHTAITIAIQKGASLEKVKEFAGHESAFTTARYIHSINKLQDNAGDLIDIFDD